MSYEQMSGMDINVRVADALGILSDIFVGREKLTRHCVDGAPLHQAHDLDYCNNPADAWPVIVESGITLEFCNGEFMAALRYEIHDGVVLHMHEVAGVDNPLRAAMVVFLMMQEGAS